MVFCKGANIYKYYFNLYPKIQYIKVEKICLLEFYERFTIGTLPYQFIADLK